MPSPMKLAQRATQLLIAALVVSGAQARADAAPEPSPVKLSAVASVDRAKLDRTLAAARALVQSHGLEQYRLRFDVIGFPPHGRAVWRRDVLQSGQIGH